MITRRIGTALASAACVGLLAVQPAAADTPVDPDPVPVPVPVPVEPYTVMGDYVRSLIYWHLHPDWGFGTVAPAAPQASGT